MDEWRRVAQQPGAGGAARGRRRRQVTGSGPGAGLVVVLTLFAAAAVAGFLATDEPACLVAAGLVILLTAGGQVRDLVERRRFRRRDLDAQASAGPPQVNVQMSEQTDFAQLADDRFLRYFSDDFFELWLWYQPDGRSLVSFQLAHWSGERRTEITCREDGTFFVFGFFSEGRRELAAVVSQEDVASRLGIVDEFRSHAREIDQDVAGYVVRRLDDAALVFAQRN